MRSALFNERQSIREEDAAPLPAFLLVNRLLPLASSKSGFWAPKVLGTDRISIPPTSKHPVEWASPSSIFFLFFRARSFSSMIAGNSVFLSSLPTDVVIETLVREGSFFPFPREYGLFFLATSARLSSDDFSDASSPAAKNSGIGSVPFLAS